jgi:hypothetical protein
MFHWPNIPGFQLPLFPMAGNPKLEIKNFGKQQLHLSDPSKLNTS